MVHLSLRISRRVVGRLALLSATLATNPGCTFYTDCPCADGTGGTTGTSGSGGTGGSSSGAGGGVVAGSPSDIEGEWVNVTGNLANQPSACGNLGNLVTKPDEDVLIAGVNRGGLWASEDGGEVWYQLGTGEDSASIINGVAVITFDPQNPDVFWEAGTYYGGGVYRTDDGGETFRQLGLTAHHDYVSIDFDDPERATLLAGGHEQRQKIYRSTNGGEDWEEIGENFPSDANITSYPLVVDAQTYLVGCPWYGDGVRGIYRSEDAGETWTLASPAGGQSAPLVASDGSIYWNVENAGGLVRSTDRGETWERVLGPDVITNVRPIELPDGRLAAVTQTAVVVSNDFGETWEYVTPELPYQAAGIAYSEHRKAFYFWHGDCGDFVLPDAIMRFDFDYEMP